MIAVILPFILAHWRGFVMGIGAVILGAIVWHYVAEVKQAFADQAKIPELEHTITEQRALAETIRKQSAITTASSMAGELHQTQIRTVTNTIVKEVPVYVPASVDTVLPTGFVRMYDDGIVGEHTLPGAAGQPDDAPSGVHLSQAGTVQAENNGTCNGIRAQLLDLQDWIRKQQALAGAKP